MSVRDGLVVIVPKGFDHSRIPELLTDRKRWLEKTALRIEEHREFLQAQPPDAVPARINLTAISEEWAVECLSSDGAMLRMRECEGNRLLLTGDVANFQVCQCLFKRWLAHKARAHLVPWLMGLAKENGFRIGRIAVKFQRTRWGSCSRRGTINLNAQSLFLPPDIVRYILIHELCHTVHLNHGKRFWALVGKHSPDYKEKRKRLRQAWRLVPAWMERCGTV